MIKVFSIFNILCVYLWDISPGVFNWWHNNQWIVWEISFNVQVTLLKKMSTEGVLTLNTVEYLAHWIWYFFCCLMTVAGHWSWHPSVTRRQFSASSSDFNQEFIKSSQNYQSKSRGVHIVCLPAMSLVCQDILT